MTFICNAGPVIALAKIDHLHLLRDLSDSVFIPETVFHEVLAKPGCDADRILKASNEFVKVCPIRQTIDPAIDLAPRHLDAGEKQVIALASSGQPPVTAVLDDAAGRRVASQLGIALLGFVGILLVAKKRNLIPSVYPLLELTRSEGYWLSEELLGIAKNLAKE